MSLQVITSYLDTCLRLQDIADYPNALNGLQLENGGTVTRLGAAVDASEAVIGMAIVARVDLLIVHHGLYWGGLAPMVGPLHRKFRRAFQADLAIYSAHLPLDLHPEFGNNVLLARALGLPCQEPFFHSRGHALGVAAQVDLERSALVTSLEQAVRGRVWVCPAGSSRVRRVGIVTGGAGDQVAKAAAEGVDTFITGEGPHHAFALAEELGINLLYGGHYATETFGVRALAEHAANKFGLPWTFLDHPSGL
ncbi:MAG TPA: Nif3-like dinuclear metal center hexameric protein [Chthoniobacterales bacterium]